MITLNSWNNKRIITLRWDWVNLLKSRGTTEKILGILLAVFGAGLFLYSLVSTIGMREYYVGTLYDSFFTYLLGAIFGRLGWGMHFGVTLLLIGIYLLRGRKLPAVFEEETGAQVERDMRVQRSDISVMEWFGILILIAIPLVNIIMLIIWAFGSENTKKNFSLAVLLYMLVAIIISIIIVIAIIPMM